MVILRIAKYTKFVYNIDVRQRGHAKTNSPCYRKENKVEEMNNQQLNTLLEQIAKLIEAKAQTPQEAAQIVREAKTKA